MNCPNCGQPLREDASFCLNCGQKITLRQEPAEAKETTENRKKPFLIVCLALTVVIAAVIAIVLLLPKHPLDESDVRERFIQELQANREGIFAFAESCQMQHPVAVYDINGSGIEDLLYASDEFGGRGVMPYMYDADGTVKKNDTNLISDFILFFDRSDGTLYHYTHTYGDDYTLYVLDGQLVRLGWYYYHPSVAEYGYSLNGAYDHDELAQREYDKTLNRLREDEITVLLTTFDDERLHAFFGRSVDDLSMTYEEALQYVTTGERPAREASAELTEAASPWVGVWAADTGETLEITAASETGVSLIYHHWGEDGSALHTSYEMVFDNAEKTVASEPGDVSQMGWKYSMELHDGYLTLKSRYPDKNFYRQ